jgi:RimJ/RimL family protein N-acetyltransferase
MINFYKTFETDQVLLRPLIAEDISHFKPITSEKEMWLFFTDDLSNTSILQKWVETGISQMKQKTRLAFTIIDKANNKTIGSTSLGNISERDKRRGHSQKSYFNDK